MAGRIVVDVTDGIAVVTLAHTDKRNAVSSDMWRAIGSFAESCRSRQDVRCVIFVGEGDVFSAGADISGFAKERSSAVLAKEFDDLVEGTCVAVEGIRQPTIAAIEGLCIGAGASLASSCDFRLASTAAKFAVPAARLGLGYDDRGILRFLKLFGQSLTKELLLTADRLPAERAYAVGAVYQLCDPGSVLAEARGLAERLSSNAPLTLAAAKAAIRAISAGSEAALDEARQLAKAADESADYAEGRAAFADKRAPNFRGM